MSRMSLQALRQDLRAVRRKHSGANSNFHFKKDLHHNTPRIKGSLPTPHSCTAASRCNFLHCNRTYTPPYRPIHVALIPPLCSSSSSPSHTLADLDPSTISRFLSLSRSLRLLQYMYSIPFGDGVCGSLSE